MSHVPGRRRPVSWWMRGVVASALLVLTGCSGAVEVDPPDLDGADSSACAAVVDDLPDQLADEDSRDIDPADAAAAAYGDPAIVVTCGVDVPTDFDQTSECEDADGVGWFIPTEERNDPDRDLTLTAVGWEPRVQVVVPADYRPDDPSVGNDVVASVFSQLAEPIKAHLKLVDDCV